jgi:hypothetical protein
MGSKLSENERNTLEHAQQHPSNRQSTLPIKIHFLMIMLK